MTLNEIINGQHTDGVFFRREQWPADKAAVRKATIADQDYINVPEGDDVLVEDCVKPMDCKVRVYLPSHEDQESDDWMPVVN